ncbi:hypothetical protein G9A89_016009 [Geosiphon pyriformis]|nr:hypothetical protein G9A89_016009 [Geosiphon pyriformis]
MTITREILKSGGGGDDQSPDGVDDHELNPSKYSPYGPNNSVFFCLLWNGNHLNADVTVDGNVSVDDMLMALPDQNIQNTFYTLHEYWIKNYPNATLTIGKQTTITNNNRTHTVIKPKKTTIRRKKIGSKIDKYLLESITAAILTPSMTIGKTIKEILPIDKNLSYGRQLELYGHLGEIIEEMKLIKKTTSEIQVEILGIIYLDVSRVLTIARKTKTVIQRFDLLDTKLILSQVLYTLSTKDFNKLVNFELNKTFQLEYPINSLILPELNLFGEDDIMIETHNYY